MFMYYEIWTIIYLTFPIFETVETVNHKTVEGNGKLKGPTARRTVSVIDMYLLLNNAKQ